MKQSKNYPCPTTDYPNTASHRSEEQLETLCSTCLSKALAEEEVTLERHIEILKQRNVELKDSLCNALAELNKLKNCSKPEEDAAVKAFMQTSETIVTIYNTVAAGGQAPEVLEELIELKDCLRRVLQLD